jgi:hypothetical protein
MSSGNPVQGSIEYFKIVDDLSVNQKNNLSGSNQVLTPS